MRDKNILFSWFCLTNLLTNGCSLSWYNTYKIGTVNTRAFSKSIKTEVLNGLINKLSNSNGATKVVRLERK